VSMNGINLAKAVNRECSDEHNETQKQREALENGLFHSLSTESNDTMCSGVIDLKIIG